jgi:two-component system, NtrC family, sensor kinase
LRTCSPIPNTPMLISRPRRGSGRSLACPCCEGQAIGVLFRGRTTVGLFAEKQIALLQTFADQAVIAIENARLFEEVEARTEDLRESLQQQTATADVLKTISRSAFDLKTVLQTLVESAARLVGADKGTIAHRRGDAFYREAFYGFSQAFRERVAEIPLVPERGSASGRALLEGQIVHVVDVHTDPEYTLLERVQLDEIATILGVPMLREGEPIGVLVLVRDRPRAFAEKEIALVSTFADQAAIAIANVRLFEQVESRTRQLEQALDGLRSAQDRLVQTEKLASLGQLTAGIAHEIKNPLNFVNNFASLSKELTEELKQAVNEVPMDSAVRTNVDELISTLTGNLDKVSQHGKRADSIVKNMLLHSREGTGEHRLVGINGLVEESLNLAYHGARAEKPDFNVKLERELDPNAGEADIYPQEVTRVLLNLISNGFYASAKRKSQTPHSDFMPALTMTTKDLGPSVEIRIRDNGVGITEEIKEKMFNPFFTTKPAGEGTGLGLSISHDIIVKRHGGHLNVSSEPGEYTEFKITLPRSGPQLKQRGSAQ